VCAFLHVPPEQLRTDVDRRVAELAARQGGRVGRAQLVALGLRRGAIDARIARGWLHPVHRGVYAVGHPGAAPSSIWWAAVLGGGGPQRTVLSFRSATARLDLLPMPGGPVDVTTLGASRSQPGIRVHRTRSLPAHDVLRDDGGPPTTTPTRTLIDLARTASAATVRRAVQRAEVLRVLDVGALAGVRSKALRAALDELAAGGPDLTRSELEVRFLALIARHGLPHPLVNATVCGHEVDFLWPHARLVVETDGEAVHGARGAFERDRRRDAELMLAGYRVVRFTWRQVVEEAAFVAATVAGLLRRSAGARSASSSR
jgi:hypothetical protein